MDLFFLKWKSGKINNTCVRVKKVQFHVQKQEEKKFPLAKIDK